MPDPFISRGDLSDRLGRDVTADPGALSAVDASCEICRNISAQTFEPPTTDTVMLDGTGTDCLLLPQDPALAAGTVLVNGGTLDSTEYVLAEGGRLIRKTLGVSTAPVSNSWLSWSGGAVWPRGRQNVQVTYDHGAGTVPSDVREVALQLAMRAVVQGVAINEQVGDVRVTYAVPALELTKNELRILQRHRRPRSF